MITTVLVLTCTEAGLLIIDLGTYLYIRPKRRMQDDPFLCMMVCFLAMQVSQYLMYITLSRPGGVGAYEDLLYLWFSMGTLSYNMLLLCFLRFAEGIVHIEEKRRRFVDRFTTVVMIISFVIWVQTIFTGTIVRFTPEGIEHGKLYWLGQVGGYLLAVTAILEILRCRRRLGRRDTTFLLLLPTVPILASIARMFLPEIGWMSLGMTFVIQLIFQTICIDQSFALRRQEKRVEETRVKIALSQVRPHFTYNVLNTIYILCGKDPAKAQEAVLLFSRYLRKNFEHLGREAPVPFSEEMSHVRTYLELERMRFGDHLRVEEDLAETDFCVPMFIVQPIVENAVQHGIQKKENGGTIKLWTRRDGGDAIVIGVQDDGVGFDPRKIDADENSHVGLQNVENRLRWLCGGTLEIESSKDEGTTVRICIPLAYGRKAESVTDM